MKKIPMNIFTLLAFVGTVTFIFKAVNVLTYETAKAPAISSAQAEDKAAAKDSAVPTKADLTKAIEQTKKAVDAGGGTEDGNPAPAPAADKDAASPTAADTAADTPAPQENFSPSEIEVLQSLSKRRDALDAREKKIAQREALLAAAEKEVDKKVEELKKLQADIKKLLGQQQTMQEDRIMSLVKIYEGMKPKEAAIIFNTLDMKVLLAVIGRMNARKSAPILANMDPAKARIVTIRLAEQRKLPVTDGTNTPSAQP